MNVKAPNCTVARSGSHLPGTARRGAVGLGLVVLVLVGLFAVGFGLYFLGEEQAGPERGLTELAPASQSTEELDAEAEVYLSDPRVADLLAGCAKEYYYDRDTSDMVPVLVEKLVSGYTEPLQRSKEELAKMGPEAMEAVRRLADKWFSDETGVGYVQNALDVAVMSDEPLARQIVLRFLQHPRDQFRRMALRGMAQRHARPEDFEPLWFQLEVESYAIQELVIPGMYKADPVRAEELFLDWIASNSHSQLWIQVAPLIAGSTRPETSARCIELQVGAPPAVRAALAACAARAGDEPSRQVLFELLADENELNRERVAFACGRAQQVEPLLLALASDTSAVVRIAAASALASLESSAEIDARLSESLGDSDETVRKIVLEALVRRGDAAATDQALALLEGDNETRNVALSVLREAMMADAELADRARGRLVFVDQTRKQLPLEERFAVLKSLGAIPGSETAKYLREVALAHPGELGKRRVHQMLLVHASNSGESGRGWLYEQLATETDGLKRIDLLWASTCFRTDEARERLFDFLSDEARSPYEVLFVSDQLARLGPAPEVAPLLKRICYRITREDVRQGMRCLLWKWY